ncbi:MAG: BLUF domain-containing protein [Saprospiraceae bacterium]|nr:BLUF domain-containing protein [Saprospiraceae bacterium]
MKRITYISRITNPLSIKEIKTIGMISTKNNKQVNITGLLVFFEKLFFQIIEGDDKEVNRLYVKIGKDPRHGDILRIKTEHGINERLFPIWSMKTINLDNNVDDLLRPIKILLQTVVDSHSIVEKYTQPTIRKILNEGINPLTVAPVRVERVILFADIVSYTVISGKMPTEDILLILNTYFEICSRIIFKNGGEVNKFIGDGLMAYFDVSLADNAIHACLEILEELQILHQNSLENSPLQLLHSGFGLAQGSVIEGNMGSNYKTDYTIIGDAVNIASRLEGVTREVNRSLVFSESLKQSTKKPWPFINLGKLNLKGKKYESEVYSIDHELVNNLRGPIS